MDAGGEKLYRSCARGGTPWKRSGSCEACLPARGPRPSRRRRRRREVRLLCWVGQLGVVGKLAELGGTTELEGVAVFSTAGSAAAWESEEDGSDGAGQLGGALGVSAGGGRGRRTRGFRASSRAKFSSLANQILNACGRRIPIRRPRIGWGEIPQGRLSEWGNFAGKKE